MDPDETEHVRSTVRRLLDDGVQRRDPQAYFDRTYHPDVTIDEAPSLPYGGTYRGLDGAARHAVAFTRTWDALQPTPAARRLRYVVHALPGAAFVAWSLSAVDPRTDRLVSFPAVSHYEFDDGLIRRSRMLLFDTHAVLDLLRRAGAR
ncbi:nuclear transport factor 2 family protein [Modestobacter sp. I12A-02662]|uniref:nuclear transport factor 2 family protein n=1 Tax=Modestobacter sp. I12A-02662 TaxID=1730496 RepID=UPI0034DEFD7F